MIWPACRSDDLVLTPRGLRLGARIYPCSIGRAGLTRDKREGDRATPRGIWRITGMLYRPDRIPCPAPWAQPILQGDLWSDDSADPDYNRPVRAPHDYSHENLRRADPLYDLVLLTDWNAAGLPGRGSAIFLHQWRRRCYPTAGCIALPRAVLHQIAPKLPPGTRVIVR